MQVIAIYKSNKPSSLDQGQAGTVKQEPRPCYWVRWKVRMQHWFTGARRGLGAAGTSKSVTLLLIFDGVCGKCIRAVLIFYF